MATFVRIPDVFKMPEEKVWRAALATIEAMRVRKVCLLKIR